MATPTWKSHVWIPVVLALLTGLVAALKTGLIKDVANSIDDFFYPKTYTLTIALNPSAYQ